MSEVLIHCEQVSKKFCRSLKRSLWYGVTDASRDLFMWSVSQEAQNRRKAVLRDDEFWASRDISFEVKRGECLGLIGRNGAGKTTLLKMLNGLIKPDTGRIELRGRIGALIALGAGFNPILSGRENIRVNAAILGFSRKQIKDHIDDIVDFAELHEFIDTPVRNYSSGMQVRLGFAITTILEPDILLLDEILAVGDASFRHKCYSRINTLIRRSAVILVSHSMDSISAVSSSVGLLQRGVFKYFPNVVDGIAAYNNDNSVAEACDVDGGRVFAVYPPVTWAELRIHNPVVDYCGCLDVSINLDCVQSLSNLIISFTAVDQYGQPVMDWNSGRSNTPIDFPAGQITFRFRIDPLQLHDGTYRWNLWIGKRGCIEALVYAMRAGTFRVRSRFCPIASIPYLPQPSTFEILTTSPRDSEPPHDLADPQSIDGMAAPLTK